MSLVRSISISVRSWIEFSLVEISCSAPGEDEEVFGEFCSDTGSEAGTGSDGLAGWLDSPRTRAVNSSSLEVISAESD